MIEKVIHIIPLKARVFISRIFRSIKYTSRLKKIYNSRGNESIIFVLNVASHGNMGDQLIAFAMEKFLSDFFPNIRVEFFSTGELECGVKYLKRVVSENDTVLIAGGGFLGDIYKDEEKRFHDVLDFFSNNRILIFPQTFCFEENSVLLQRAELLHKKCCHLTIAAREKKSYIFLKSHFNKARILLVPDITTYLNYSNIIKPRNGRICICSRNDKEKTKQSSEQFGLVVKWADDNGVPIDYLDTQVPYSVNSSIRNLEIKKMIAAFSSYELVVTDRLHGMLYSLISGTPVIAIDNNTQKISGSYYDWFVDVPYVSLYEKDDDISQQIESFYKMGGQLFDNMPYVKELKKLLEYVYS